MSPTLLAVYCTMLGKKKKELQAKKANKKKMDYAIRWFSTRLADASIPPYCCRVPIYKSPRLMCLLLQSNGCEESFFPVGFRASYYDSLACLLLVVEWVC